MYDDVKIIPEEDYDMDDNDKKEVDAINDVYEEEGHKGLLEEDDDNHYENDDDYFTDSLFVVDIDHYVMRNCCKRNRTCVFVCLNLS